MYSFVVDERYLAPYGVLWYCLGISGAVWCYLLQSGDVLVLYGAARSLRVGGTCLVLSGAVQCCPMLFGVRQTECDGGRTAGGRRKAQGVDVETQESFQ